ncbi:MAG TPA: MFS transporter [Coriobacteriia bacterium]|nr:MFS transporter [Coriobacteriia bacterium]
MTEEHLDLEEYEEPKSTIQKIILASSAGTMIEWYDFYIFGSLTTVIASKFYNTGTSLGDTIAWLLTFAIGFMVRPFGAVFFGRLGDIVGRKYTFFITMSLMGLCTFAVGILPTQATIGMLAGIILVILRVLQGLALGGEYGGAATYVAEHAPHGKRGFYTSFIQITATFGLFLSLGVILATKMSLTPEAFDAWGWRIPFLVSILLVGVSIYIRYSLRESPLYAKKKAAGQLSKNPLVESFVNPVNLKWVILALLGATMGQGVVWYTGQFYALFYIQKVFHVGLVDSNVIVAGALLAATPFFIFFGWLSDKIGRKSIILAGMLVAVLTWYPIYGLMAANAPSQYAASKDDVKNFAKAADAAKTVGDEVPTVAIPTVEGDPTQSEKVPVTQIKEGDPLNVKFEKFLFDYSGYNPFILAFCVFLQVFYVTMVYGPIAAFLVELFPTKIRYTSMSLPYHLGNGVFGGLVPIVGLSLLSSTGNNYAGLWYPMVITAVCFVIGAIFIKETFHIDIHKDESYADEANAKKMRSV